MKLKHLAEIKVQFKHADFWIVRRGTLESVGSVTRDYNPEHYGVKVTRTDILVPDFLYYAMMDLHSRNYYKVLAHGSLPLVNIRIADIENITLG